MTYNIGINVIEVDGSASPTITGASVSVAGFNILTQRGIANTPIRVTSFQQFVERFGSYFAEGFGAYMVKGFFDNGGQTAIINRIVADNAAPASLMLTGGTPAANVLEIKAGFRGKEDPGTWANTLFVRTTASSSVASRLLETAPATIRSTSLTTPLDMSGSPSLSLLIDGETTPSEIQFRMADFSNANQATLEEIRDAINRRTPYVIASTDNQQLVLTSSGSHALTRQGWTSLQVTADNTMPGFSVMNEPVRGTPAAITTTSTQLNTISDFAVGDAIRIEEGSDSAIAKVLRIVPATNTIEWTPALADTDLYDPFETRISTIEFDLAIAQGGTEDEDILENWTGLSMEPDVDTYAPARINSELNGSQYIIVDDQNATTPVRNVPSTQDFTRLTPGTTGTATAAHFIGSAATRTGFYAFESYDIQLLTCERTDAPAIVREALTYCARRGDCMYVGAVPKDFVEGGQAIAYGQTFQGKNVYGALYGPWIKVFDMIGVGSAPSKWIPPSGHIMGVYARISTTRGVWKAPAGDEALLAGALDVEYRLSDADHTNLVISGSVNGIRAIPGAGIIIDASRTLSKDIRWQYVNVRLLFNFVKSSLRQGLRWTRQEPNRSTLWNVINYNTVTPFLLGLWQQGAFGTGSPDEVFTVICDATNNPPEEVDKGNLKVEVYFYPSKPAETIVIIVGQQPSGGSVTEQ